MLPSHCNPQGVPLRLILTPRGDPWEKSMKKEGYSITALFMKKLKNFLRGLLKLNGRNDQAIV